MPAITPTSIPSTATTPRGERSAAPLAEASIWVLYAALLWPALAGGGHAGWPLATTQLLVLLSALGWALSMAASGRLEWRRTAVDLPLGLLLLLIALQLVVGSGPLSPWALAPPESSAPLPARFLGVGTVSPGDTARALLLCLTYAAVYVLVVNLVRRREDVERLIRTLLVAGGLLAFASLVDFLSREAWLFSWREGRLGARLAGPFPNPDHWASWLVMLICLSVGYLSARRGRAGDDEPGLAGVLRSPETREAALRRYLPAFGVGLMALAVILTLSRGALLSLAVAGALGLLGLGRLGGLRWSLALVGALCAGILGFGLWIGMEPLLERLGSADSLTRWLQWRASLPMLATFPVLGVGLGAYKEIFFRFQPAALGAGSMYFPYAHSDLLQLAIETGPLGAALFLWALVRVSRDLAGAHLFGRGRCPVMPGGGSRRSDPFSVGVTLGGVGAVVALLVHSTVDFSARIPADGILAAACLGLATTAAHTRFTAAGPRPTEAVRRWSLGSGLLRRAGAGTLAVGLAIVLVPWILGPAMALASPSQEMEARSRIARRFLDVPGASEIDTGTGGLIDRLRDALRSRPTNPYLHEQLAWALELAAVTSPERASHLRLAALAQMERALALQPENPFLYRSQAALALTGAGPRLDLALAAGRQAIGRRPALIPDLVDRLAPRMLDAAQWATLVPPRAADRAALASHLEFRGFLRESAALYERALEGAAPAEAPVIRWALARLLLGMRQPARALEQMDAALATAPDSPELALARADAFAALGRPEALGGYRRALASARASVDNGQRALFAAQAPELRALVKDRLGAESALSVARYRRALAQRLTDERQWSAALVEWDRALTESPLDARGHFSRGLALDGAGHHGRAIEAYKNAVALAGATPSYRARLAQSFWDNDQYVEAITEWQTLSAREPRSVEMRLALGRAYVKVGEPARALLEYRRVLALAPDHAEARQSVARLVARP
jgi:tetratricopeptide (TPR) repeat protein